MNEYFVLQPAKFRLDGGAMFGIIPKPMWEKCLAPDTHNRIDLGLNLVLIQNKTHKKNILIDTGIGEYHGDKFDERFDVRYETTALEKELARININLKEISDVVISHLHFDHVGGMFDFDPEEKKFKCKFSNAMIHLHKKHYEYSLNPSLKDAGSFHTSIYQEIIEQLSKDGRVNWLQDEKGKLNLGDFSSAIDLYYECSHGHTPYMTHLYNEKFYYLSDILPTSHHLHIPWVMAYDLMPGVTTKEKIKTLEKIYSEKMMMIFEHDPLIWGAKLEKENNKTPFKLSSIQKISTQHKDKLVVD